MIVDRNSSLLAPSLARAMSDLRTSYDDLNRQLTTGTISDTYGGLGDGRSVSLSMRARYTEAQGYRDSIADVSLRIKVMGTTLDRLGSLATEQRSDTNPTESTLINNGQTRAQLAASTRFQEAISLLRTDVAGRHLFSGRATDADPVADSKVILDGEGTKTGLRGVIAERRAADLGTVDVDLAGADSVGRLSISAASGTAFSLAEDGTHPFGFKLAGGATTIAGASVTLDQTPPASVAVSMPSQPTEGQTVRLSFKLPDGSSDEIVLNATANPTRSDDFAIGATADDTLANLRNAVVKNLDTRSQTTLSAASAIQAGADFFAGGPNTPPKRVDGTPATATALRDATPTDTVTWYKGDDDPGVSARNSVTARIDNSVSVSYGVRANESGIAKTVRTLAVFAAETASSTDPNQPARNEALASRVRTELNPTTGAGTLNSLQVDLASAAGSAKSIDERQTILQGVAQDLIGATENADKQAVAAALLSVNTRLQATYQTTSMLSKMTLANYI